MSVTLEVNGVKHTVDASPEASLLEILRNDLGMTGTKFGCGESMCGACTVLQDGYSIHSCITTLADVGTDPITTIEGLEKDGKLHPLQKALLDEGAMQCGYCSTGMIMAAISLLKRHPEPTDEQIIQGMSGNICRCGTYPRLIAAIKKAAVEMRSKK